jgi:hypothetical protein
LDTPTPEDWSDPVMTSLRTHRLERAASVAAEAMVELLVRLHDERARCVHMNEGNSVLTCNDAMFGLRRELVAYRRDTLRLDGETIAYETMVKAHGAGVAALTLRSLAELRRLITHEMRAAS